MPSAVDDVEHRNGQRERLAAVEPGVERAALAHCGGVRDSERDAKNRVRTQVALVVCTVQFDERVVYLPAGHPPPGLQAQER